MAQLVDLWSKWADHDESSKPIHYCITHRTMTDPLMYAILMVPFTINKKPQSC